MRAIDESARTVLGPHDRIGRSLADEVARLSETYTRDRGALRTQSAALAARMRFFLPRDLPKIEGPLSELAWAGALPKGPRWSVLDLGAGLGTSTLGIATFAKRVEPALEGLDVLAIERDPRSLEVMRHLARRSGIGELAEISVPIALEGRELDLERLDPRNFGSPFSLIVLGLAMNELWIDRDDRIEKRAMFLTRALEALEEDGALIVIEPALREPTRELMALRDQLLGGEAAQVHVFAPCTHRGPCPLRARERDWCHEDLDLALPPALATIARGAGLRFEGLSYSYLTLRRAAGTLGEGAHRIVGGPIATKGRTEWQACGEHGLVKIARLDRHSDEGDPMREARRGSIVTIEGPPSESIRTDRARLTRRR